METLILLGLFYGPTLIEFAVDPVDGYLATTALPDTDCEPLTIEAARRVAPDQVPPPSARGDYLDRRAVICRERLMPRGVRRPQDDAILSTLRHTAEEMAGLVDALAAHRDRVWLVEAFHPDPAVTYKIGFAVKNALLERDLRVSDRAPTLAAADIEVIGQVPQAQAWPLACKRYVATGSLGPDRALLAVALRDPRATVLHAGLCVDGVWRWLR